MVAPEFILFVMLDILVLTWTVLKVLVVTYQLDYEPQPPRAPTKELEASEPLRKAA
jgi:hypothetical protein